MPTDTVRERKLDQLMWTLKYPCTMSPISKSSISELKTKRKATHSVGSASSPNHHRTSVVLERRTIICVVLLILAEIKEPNTNFFLNVSQLYYPIIKHCSDSKVSPAKIDCVSQKWTKKWRYCMLKRDFFLFWSSVVRSTVEICIKLRYESRTRKSSSVFFFH